MLSRFLKRHRLLLGFVAVLVPLSIMMGLQFFWLGRLARVSAIAHQAALSNYLATVGTKVQYFYRSTAERALNLPASLFLQGHLEKAAHYWKKKPVEGARLLFLADFTEMQFGSFRVYDPSRQVLEAPPASDEALAIIVACTPWQMLSYREGVVETPTLSVDERDPDYRIIVNPITDDASHVVGVAGMILDEDYFIKELLPSVIKDAVPDYFPAAESEDIVVSVRDGRGRLVLATRDHKGDGEAVSAGIPFVFANWTVSLHSMNFTPEQWARIQFVFNATLSGLLAIVVLAGIILALRAANRAMTLSEMKSEFVSNVSHELRTPISSIRVFAELMRLGRVANPVKVQEYGEYIEAESRRLSRLIDNILNFSRIESGAKTYNFIRADVCEVVAAAVKTFEVRLKPRGFRIRFECPDSAPELRMDPDAIGQAIHNLLDNAVKYSGESRDIALRVTVEPGAVVIAAQDNGVGIAPEEQKKIFDRFHRVSTGLVHNVKGSGLGLSIVHHIVQAHRGRVTVESEPGQGSTFSIHLPIEPAGQPTAPHLSHEEIESGA